MPSPSTDAPEPLATPWLLLESLRIHLLPTPLLNALPTALQCFAHLQEVGETVKRGAARALKEHGRWVEELETKGVIPEEQVQWGALSKAEGKRLRQIKDRLGYDEGLAFSFQLRRYHLAILLSMPKLPLPQARHMIDVYFPHIKLGDIKTQMRDEMLYIRAMPTERLNLLRDFRPLEWYEAADDARKRAEAGPTSSEMLGTVTDTWPEICARNMLRETEGIVRDYDDLLAMFARSEGSVSLRAPSQRDLVDERQKHVGGVAAKRVPVAGPSRPFKSVKRRTPPIRQRSPLSPSSPVAARQTSIPHVTFETIRGKTRMSIDRRGSTPASVSVTARSKAKIAAESVDVPGLPPAQPAEAGAPTPRTKSPPPIKVIKPRPRSSNPASGPDYTAPSPAFGSNIPKADLKPFDNSRLVRASQAKRSRLALGADENSPRVDKKAKAEIGRGLADATSQENSQPSGESIEVVQKKDKGKGREVPPPDDIFS